MERDHVVGKNVWSAPTKLGKDGHYRDSLPRQRARSYHQYWPTSSSRSFAECVRNVMIGVLMDTQTCSKYASQMHIKLLKNINNATIERFCNQQRLIISFSAMSAAQPFVRRVFVEYYCICTIYKTDRSGSRLTKWCKKYKACTIIFVFITCHTVVLPQPKMLRTFRAYVHFPCLCCKTCKKYARAPFKSLCPYISPSWWRCPWPPWRRCCWLRVDVEY